MNRVIHPFGPIYDENSQILFVGSIASIKSREYGYPYASPHNRFWKVLEIIFNERMMDYKKFLLKHNIALWDAIKSCEIVGSSDASIKNIEVNEIWEITKNSKIKKVFTNGKTAFKIYQKYIYPKTLIPAICLPSTSPANAGKKLEELVEDYRIILKYLYVK
ncbi:MAG: DNA-deoxyinosine glycosylase [Mollicutes bacterium]|nr:DNA-deoxyinosine glycosylase [Mollicutes bacterium]